MAEEKIPGAHALLALELDVAQKQAAFPGGNQDSVFVRAENFAGFARAFPAADGAEYLQDAPAKDRMRGGPRIHRADFSLDLNLRGAPVDAAALAGELWRIGGRRGVLRLTRGVSRLQERERVRKRCGGKQSQAVVQGSRGVAAKDGKLLAQKDVARVEAFVDIHDGDAREIGRASCRE